MMNFCTLFDSYYLDKGLALYSSLEKVSEDFTLYVFCFDEDSYEILEKKSFSHMVVLRQNVFETDELLALKRERSKAEYCWTCTSVIIFLLGSEDYIRRDLRQQGRCSDCAPSF